MIKVEVIKTFNIAVSTDAKKSYLFLDEDRAKELEEKGFVKKVETKPEKATLPKKNIEKRK